MGVTKMSKTERILEIAGNVTEWVFIAGLIACLLFLLAFAGYYAIQH
jgi:hypothetical protein